MGRTQLLIEILKLFPAEKYLKNIRVGSVGTCEVRVGFCEKTEPHGNRVEHPKNMKQIMLNFSSRN